ncbi:uncharacterized protein [Oryctolagus cuniculus]|uniref:uncharacterized protein isoform X2 n=1 Tax=Oryctolagus cuniculus TaxID=9986 RepID=UPI0038798785
MRPAPTTVAGRAWGSAEPTGTCSPVFLLSFERIRGVDWKRGDIFGLWTQNNLFHGHKVSSCLEKGTQQFSGPTCSVSTLPLSLQCWSLFPVPLIAVGFCDCLDEWNKQKISVSWWKVMRVHLLFCLCTHTQLWEPCPEAVTLQRSREETIQEYREKAKEPQLFNSSQQALSGYERKLSCSELHILAAAFDSPYMNCTMMCKLHGLHFPLCPSTALRPFLFSKSDDENLKNTDPI